MNRQELFNDLEGCGCLLLTVSAPFILALALALVKCCVEGGAM
jgi:hypothetical protein